MVLKRENIASRLRELDTVLEELLKYKDITVDEIKASLSRRWIIERGLIAGANLIFDIADHILAARFHLYPETYEDSLNLLHEKGIINSGLFEKMKGFGGFRNVLVHGYLGIDLNEEHKNYLKALVIFREFGGDILTSEIFREQDSPDA